MTQTRSEKVNALPASSRTRSGIATAPSSATVLQTRSGERTMPPKSSTLSTRVPKTMNPLITINNIEPISTAIITHPAITTKDSASASSAHIAVDIESSATVVDSMSVSTAISVPASQESPGVPTTSSTSEPDVSISDAAIKNGPASTSLYASAIIDSVPKTRGSAAIVVELLAIKSDADDAKLPASLPKVLETDSAVPSSLMAKIEIIQDSKPRMKRKRLSKTPSDHQFHQVVTTIPNSLENPILLDEPNDVSPPHNIKQVLKLRQLTLERMSSILENLAVHIQSTADSDQTGDYGSMALWERRSFEDFVSDLLDDSDQPKSLVQDLVYEITEYQGILRRTKEFRSR